MQRAVRSSSANPDNKNGIHRFFAILLDTRYAGGSVFSAQKKTDYAIRVKEKKNTYAVATATADAFLLSKRTRLIQLVQAWRRVIVPFIDMVTQ
jgi:hypothetical protein